MENIYIFWLLASLAFLLLEMGNPGLFYFLSFCFGTLLAALTSVYFESVVIQSLLFLGGTVLSLFILKSWVKRKEQLFKSNQTNVYAIIGKRAVVVKEINPGVIGQVKVDGQIWSVKTQQDQTLTIGCPVMIVNIAGNHVIVKKLNNN